MSTDRDLLDALAAVLDQVDPVPPHLAEAALFRPPADLVPLTWLADSAVATPPNTRGAGPSRTLHLGHEGDGTTVDLRLDTVDDRGVRALGLVHPPRGGTVHVTWPHGGTAGDIDDVGWFQADLLPTGPLRFVISQPGLPDLSTGWFVQ
ncbi:hypothetical protein [Umezawaea sp.]|uniref:hypothetical protein n=1 Tax=Umezawaea sp. TaxID=1955258 RepID=UPI002ED03BA6